MRKRKKKEERKNSGKAGRLEERKWMGRGKRCAFADWRRVPVELEDAPTSNREALEKYEIAVWKAAFDTISFFLFLFLFRAAACVRATAIRDCVRNLDQGPCRCLPTRNSDIATQRFARELTLFTRSTLPSPLSRPLPDAQSTAVGECVALGADIIRVHVQPSQVHVSPMRCAPGESERLDCERTRYANTSQSPRYKRTKLLLLERKKIFFEVR